MIVLSQATRDLFVPFLSFLSSKSRILLDLGSGQLRELRLKYDVFPGNPLGDLGTVTVTSRGQFPIGKRKSESHNH